MANPVIHTVTAAQITHTGGNNPGDAVRKPAIRVDVNFTHNNYLDLLPRVQVGGTWYSAITLAPGVGQNLTPPPVGQAGDFMVIIDLLATFAAHSLTLQDFAALPVDVTVQTHGLPSESAGPVAVSGGVNTHLTPATGVVMHTPTYVGQLVDSGICHFSFTCVTGTPILYKVGFTADSVDYAGSASFAALDGLNGQLQFGSQATYADGDYSVASGRPIVACVFDQYYNKSSPAYGSTYLLRTPPTNARVDIVGTNANSDYTGIAIGADGSFTHDRGATLRVSATSPKPLSYRLRPASNCEPSITVNSQAKNINDQDWITLDSTTNQPVVHLITGTAGDVPPYNAAADNFGVSELVQIAAEFKDAAGNITQTTGTIVLNTTVYQTAFKPMRKPDTAYRPILKEVIASVENPISETVPLTSEPVRKWTDIFYPAAHGYPRGSDGELDATAALTVTTPTALYDPVVGSDGKISYDADGRPNTTTWQNDGTKNYGNMLSSSVNNLVYWVLDNEGYGDITLEFERFYLDSNIYGPPYNPIAPHSGDVLVVYDASNPAALSLTYDDQGRPQWLLATDPSSDSSLLTELAAYTGSGSNVMNLTTRARMASGVNGDFVSEPFRGATRLVLILFTDASHAASGFKLRAGPAHDRIWTNWDVDETNGQVWVHKYVGQQQVNGLAPASSPRMVYDYLQGSVAFDYEAGTATFDVAPSGTVTADYSYYISDVPGTNLFVASQDDFVDYQDATLYVGIDGQDSLTDAQKLHVYENDGYGRATAHYTWDKDRGLMELTDTVPVGVRFFGDYYHHTYARLSSDGHGDLSFQDPILVADTTPAYPDFTFCDIKIVNEGEALLEDWKLTFVPRGYNTDGNLSTGIAGDGTVVDQVLDINRPWDYQLGTPAETYEKMACQIMASYLWNRSCAKVDAQNVLSTCQNQVVSFDLQPHGQAFGRVVWVLGGTGGNNYPATSRGIKRTSLEIEGKFYAMQS